MIYRLFVFIAFAICSVVYAEESGKIEVVGADAIDFGKYPAWEKKVANYKIRNAGKGDLRIIKVRKTCGCASAKCDKSELKPEEEATVEVVILPDTIFHLYSKNTFVESNDPGNRFLRLNVAGNAIPLVEVKPGTSVNAGRIKTGDAWSQSIILEGSNGEIRLGKPQVESNYPMDIDLKPAGENAGSYTLTAGLKPVEESGDLKCSINIPVETPLLVLDGVETNHTPINITISGRIGYELNIVPGIIRIPLSEEPVTRQFTLNVLGQRSRILKPDELTLPERGDVKYEVSQERGRLLTVTVTFSPEFSKMLYTEETFPLEFSVPGAASAKIVCAIKK